MDRIIEVKINGNHLTKDNRSAGVQHEANVTFLRIEFDEGWDGYAKKVTWWDAKGLNPVERTLTADLLEDLTQSTRIYLCPIPGEALAEAGLCTFVIDGYVEGKRQRSISDTLYVKEAPFIEQAGQPVDPTPTQAEQLQGQIDGMLGDMQEQAQIAQSSAAEAGSYAEQAQSQVAVAQEAATGAEAARQGAETARDEAKTALTGAEAAQSAAEAAVSHAEQAQQAAENAAAEAAKDTAADLAGQMEGYVSEAKAAQAAAEQARDEAGAVAGGDFATRAELEQAIASIPTPDVSGQINEHNEDGEAHQDIRQAISTHANRHAADGADPITPEMIKAFPLKTKGDGSVDELTTGTWGVRDSVENIPHASTGCIIYHRDWDTASATQVAVSLNGKMTQRTKVAGVWSEWREVYDTNNKPTAADVGAAPAGFGLGTIAKDISNTDLLTTLGAAASGFYMGINVTNAPDNNWWFFIVTSHNAIWSTVLALSFTDTNHVMHIGQYNEGTWAGWKKFASADDVSAVQALAEAAQTTADSKAPMYTYGTTDLTAGSSPLATGVLYFCYE